MRVLEVRFHPWRKAHGPFLVVGRILCRWRRAIVELTSATAEEAPSGAHQTMLLKLQYLVSHTQPDTYRRLRDLQSEFWSFVEVPSDAPVFSRQRNTPQKDAANPGALLACTSLEGLTA